MIEGTIDGLVKVGDLLQGNPFAHAPSFHWEISGAVLLASGTARHELGGTEPFLAVERLMDQPLPVDLKGSFEVAPRNAGFGFRPVYVSGRQSDDSNVWTSAQFITFDRYSKPPCGRRELRGCGRFPRLQVAAERSLQPERAVLPFAVKEPGDFGVMAPAEGA